MAPSEEGVFKARRCVYVSKCALLSVQRLPDTPCEGLQISFVQLFVLLQGGRAVATAKQHGGRRRREVGGPAPGWPCFCVVASQRRSTELASVRLWPAAVLSVSRIHRSAGSWHAFLLFPFVTAAAVFGGEATEERASQRRACLPASACLEGDAFSDTPRA